MFIVSTVYRYFSRFFPTDFIIFKYQLLRVDLGPLNVDVYNKIK